jgi:hypothetical protein
MLGHFTRHSPAWPDEEVWVSYASVDGLAKVTLAWNGHSFDDSDPIEANLVLAAGAEVLTSECPQGLSCNPPSTIATWLNFIYEVDRRDVTGVAIVWSGGRRDLPVRSP